MEEFLIRNIPAITPEQQSVLKQKHAVVVGAGGLGGYVCEYLARIGIGELTVIDGDVFSVSNQNRQLNATTESIGKNKAEVTAQRIKLICPNVKVHAIAEYLTEENASGLLSGADVIPDALDSISARLVLEDAASALGIPMIHAAIEGWELQVMPVRPGSGLIHRIYHNKKECSKEQNSTLSFTAGVAAGLEASLAVQILLGDTELFDDSCFFMSLKTLETWKLPMKETGKHQEDCEK